MEDKGQILLYQTPDGETRELKKETTVAKFATVIT